MNYEKACLLHHMKYQIEKYMKENGLNGFQLSELLGISKNQICRWLRGQHYPCALSRNIMKDKGVIL